MESDARKELTTGVSINLYPNPINDQFTVAYTVQQEGTVLFQLFSEDGVLLAEINNESKNPGFYEEIYYASTYGLESGIYLLKLSISGSEIAQRISVVK